MRRRAKAINSRRLLGGNNAAAKAINSRTRIVIKMGGSGKGQGSMEYLLLIAGAVVVGMIVIIGYLSITGSVGNEANSLWNKLWGSMSGGGGPTPMCNGNGVCDSGGGENCNTCLADCPCLAGEQCTNNIASGGWQCMQNCAGRGGTCCNPTDCTGSIDMDAPDCPGMVCCLGQCGSATQDMADRFVVDLSTACLRELDYGGGRRGHQIRGSPTHIWVRIGKTGGEVKIDGLTVSKPNEANLNPYEMYIQDNGACSAQCHYLPQGKTFDLSPGYDVPADSGIDGFFVNYEYGTTNGFGFIFEFTDGSTRTYSITPPGC